MLPGLTQRLSPGTLTVVSVSCYRHLSSFLLGSMVHGHHLCSFFLSFFFFCRDNVCGYFLLKPSGSGRWSCNGYINPELPATPGCLKSTDGASDTEDVCFPGNATGAAPNCVTGRNYFGKMIISENLMNNGLPAQQVKQTCADKCLR